MKLLADRSDLAAVHFITHGADGQINLGNSWLNSTTLQQNSDAVAAWGNALTESGDILFYGCNIAADSGGQNLLANIAKLTGADVAASDDNTGHTSLSGDWELEYTKGSIETGALFSAELQQNWGHLLNVAVDATSTGTSTGGDFSVSHTTSGTDRLMLVGVSMNLGGSQTVSSVTYNGDSLSLVGVEEAGDARIEIWALLAPEVVTSNVDIAFSSPTDGNTAGVMTFTGVDQSTPLGAFASDFGYGESTASATVISAADELVFGVVSIDDPNFRVLTEGAGQTERWELDGFQTTGGGSTAPGAESVNMSWTWPASDNWAAGGVSIKPSAANTAPVITSNGGGDSANISVAENTTAVTTVTATDGDGDTPIYSISDGADAALFSIDANTGVLTFNSAPNFEAPADADTNNVYEVTVQVSDGKGGTDTQAISVTVTDALELIVTNTNATGTGSLHEAILNANANTGVTDTITFNISGGGPHVINLTAALPAITDTVIIDGTTDPDYAGTPIIVLDGSGAGAVDGLSLAAGSDGSTIRGLVINNFGDAGIKLEDSNNHTIVGNYIGTDATGTANEGNSTYGIEVLNSTNNMIGGSTTADRNVIAGNSLDGITIWGPGSTLNIIQGNYIGVDSTGNTGLGNGADGIVIGGGANNNTIGGDRTAGEGNVISGQTGVNADGIEIDNVGADSNKIFGNYIGTNHDGTFAIANARHGVVIYDGVQGTEIGGTGTGQGNIISGNGEGGVVIDGNGKVTTTNNIVAGNLIGVDVTGSGDLGNATNGVEIFGSASGNLIGGESVGAGNVIAFNSLNGVNVASGATNAIVRNSIHSNTLLGIDLGTAGVTANDSGDGDGGANNLQNFPVLTSAVTTGSQITITGTLNSTASTNFRIEFYANATGDGTGYGEGQTLIGVYDVTTDGSGNAFVFGDVSRGRFGRQRHQRHRLAARWGRHGSRPPSLRRT